MCINVCMYLKFCTIIIICGTTYVYHTNKSHTNSVAISVES